jgi:CheY-like chemotaxis protein
MQGIRYRFARHSGGGVWIFSAGDEPSGKPPTEPDQDGVSRDLAAPVIAFLDDDEALLEVVSLALETFGMNVHPFSNPEALEQAVDTQVFDAFVIDWRLGERTAAKTIYRLRAIPRFAQTPIFILSGNIPVADSDWDKEMVDLLTRHQVMYRSKPYLSRTLASEILASVREHCRKH